MRLVELQLNHFRNYEELFLEFGKGVHIFIGENAQGKTNLMESIYTLAMTKSHRTNQDRELIMWNQDAATIKGKVEKKISSIPLEIRFSNKGKIDYPLSGQNTPNYDWDSLTNDFVEKIKKTTNNNEYAVDNKYYNTYLAKNYSSFRDSNKGTSYLESPEYIDYEIFLDVAKELGMEVEVIIFPVNGKWNDYTGVSKEMREQTYRNIEEIAKKYTNVKVLNYGNREYDDYFLFDVMHVGVKGWMQVERELYEFAKQN